MLFDYSCVIIFVGSGGRGEACVSVLTSKAGRTTGAQRVYNVDDQAVGSRAHGHCPGAHEESHRVEQVWQMASHVQAIVE